MIQSGDIMGAPVSISVEKKSTKLQQFISKFDLQDRLDPRESFFGGRTNAIKLHYKAEEDETIQHYDFTSIYAWTNTYCRYPVGHPTISRIIFRTCQVISVLQKSKSYNLENCITLCFPTAPKEN